MLKRLEYEFLPQPPNVIDQSLFILFYSYLIVGPLLKFTYAERKVKNEAAYSA